MRQPRLTAERLTELDPADLAAVADGEATRDGKCRSVTECDTGVRCLLSLDGCHPVAGCG